MDSRAVARRTQDPQDAPLQYHQRPIEAGTRRDLSQVELPITFGLGEASAIESASIHGPDGISQLVQDVVADDQVPIRKERR